MKFIKPAQIIAHSEIKPGSIVADFGCGAGFYTLAISKAVGNTGQVYSIDVQDKKLVSTKSASVQAGFHNVEVIKADLEKPFEEVEAGTVDYVVVASILHEVKNTEAVLKNAYALLKTGGHLLAVDWTAEPSPFGPAMEKRLPADELKALTEKMGMQFVKDIPADSFHYAMLLKK